MESEEEAVSLDAIGAFDESAREQVRLDSGETILRIAAERGLGEGHQISFGAEAALNTLEQRLALTEDDGSGPIPVVLPSANVRVEEERLEAFATFGWRPAPRWTGEASLAVEASRLTQSGDSETVAELMFWKPSLQLIRALGDDDQLRLRIYRDVEQLDFEDFVAGAEIDDASVEAGNPALAPQSSWRIEAAGDWRFGTSGALAVTLFHWAIEDTLDFVVLGAPGDQFDARGNIGDARLSGVRASFEIGVPLLPNARLRAETLWQHSAVTDPLTGETRAISEIEESALTIAFRQDFTAQRFAWGVDIEQERETPEFRLDRVSHELEAHELSVWAETTRVPGMKLRVFAANLGSPEDRRERRFFDPDRAGPFDADAFRDRGAGAMFGLSAQGAF